MKQPFSFRVIALSAVMAVVAGLPIVSSAKDTDVYLKAPDVPRDDSPNVLLIFDNSGSMRTDVESGKPAYDPSIDYTVLVGAPSVNTSRVYWSTSGTPPSASTGRWFAVSNNNCEASKPILNTTGFYGSDKIVAYKPSGSGKGWRALESDQDRVTDCQGDNGATDLNGYVRKSSINPLADYTTTASEQFDWANFTGTSATPTLYRANYMAWYHNASLNISRTRLEIAQEAVKNLIDSNRNVRFGLMVFNNNTPTPNGGRVIMKLDNMDDARRTQMKTLVDGLVADTWTPLSETMWEAYRYLAGLSVDFGDDDAAATPARDATAETVGTYISPFTFSCQKTYIIYLTDGDPTNDTGANSKIAALPGIGTISGNALDELAGWMNTNDLYSGLPEAQTAVTFTIGFGSGISAAGKQLLQDTARKGGGDYVAAGDADQLNNALRAAIAKVLSVTTSFVAPALSVNAFNTLFNRDEVYFAVFKPTLNTLWDGNIKKYTLCKGTEQSPAPACTFGEVLDKDGTPAVDPTTRRLKGTSFSYWSPTLDGNEVAIGGAGSRVPDPAARKVYTYTGGYGASGRLPTGTVDLSNAANTITDANAALTAAMMNAVDAAERTKIIQWIRGEDVGDYNGDGLFTDKRWGFADPVHSRPVAVTFGGDAVNPIVKLFVGTNDGMLHMINEKTGEEEWAFIPREILTMHKDLLLNDINEHPWGIDGTPTFRIFDRTTVGATVVDRPDGIIDPSIGDFVHMYVGMRRGGRNIYAFDVTPTTTITSATAVGGIQPKLLWSIKGGASGSTGFESLGETWSIPSLTNIRFGQATAGESAKKTVLIFSGGYDSIQDGKLPAQSGAGNAIFIIDPDTGERLWWVSGTGSGADLELGGMDYSIPSDLALLDANSDGATDRIYVGDLGGQLWRIDLSPTLKKNNNAGSVGYVFADLACTVGTRPSCTGTPLQDRRKFYYRPDVAQIVDAVFTDPTEPLTAIHDLVTIASGDREDPLDLITKSLTTPVEAVHNRIYAIRDFRTNALGTGEVRTYVAADTVKESTDLVDLTANQLADPNADKTAIRNSKGWFINLKDSSGSWVGEKASAKTVIFGGTLFVSTYTPANASTAVQTCAPNEGLGLLYGLNPLNATATLTVNNTVSDRVLATYSGLPPEIVIVLRPEGTSALLGSQTPPGVDQKSELYRDFWFDK